MKIRVYADAGAVAAESARFITDRARAMVDHHGRFSLALSGGSTPWKMLAGLVSTSFPWDQTDWFQVDERVAPAGHEERNLTQMLQVLEGKVDIPPSKLHAMPVESSDLEVAAMEYADVLRSVAGRPPSLDLVHLGLGPDGHTASLVPQDSVLDVTDSDVAITAGPYQGRLRMTLTFPAINRAREILWLVTGESKREMLQRLMDGDESIPAGRIESSAAIVFADEAAAAGLSS